MNTRWWRYLWLSVGLVIGLSALVAAFCTSDIPGLPDESTHPPPTSGTYAYDTFTPASGSFPAANSFYYDPTFGTPITRLTNIYPATGNVSGTSLTYGKSGLWNADGTAWFNQLSGVGVQIIHPQTGAVLVSPTTYPVTVIDEVSFDPLNREVYYYTNGTALSQRNWVTATTTPAHTFPATLGSLGQSGDWISSDANLFLVNYSGALHIWNRSLNLVYTGSVALPTNTCPLCPGVPGPNPGWAGISPDGNWVIVNGADQATSYRQHWSYAVDNTAHTLASSGNMFWDDCFSDHSNLMTATTGVSYMIVPSCNSDKGHYRVALTNNFTPGAGAGQLSGAGNVRLTSMAAFMPSGQMGNGHHSCAKLGVYQDWCFAAVDDYNDLIGAAGTWFPWRQEILFIHMLPPYEVYRLAHHKARGSTTAGPPYCGSARVSAMWDGSAVIFGSNMGSLGVGNTNSCGMGDSYRLSVNY